MLTGLVRYFAEVLEAECHVCCDESRRPLWVGNPTVKSIVREPLHLDAIWRPRGRAFFDYTFFLENLFESNQEPDQENGYDIM